MTRKVLIPIIGILILVIAGLFTVKTLTHSSNSAPQEQVSLDAGNKLPDFSLTNFAEKKETSFSQLPGKVLMINFWATWCEACIVEMPSINKLRKEYGGKGFELVSVNLDENPEKVLPAALKRLGIDFPVYVDRDQKLGELFDIHGIPLTVIVDSARKILFVELGERDWNGTETRNLMDQWLRGSNG